MSIRQLSSNLYVAEADPFVLHQVHIDELVNCASHHELQRARINLHTHDQASVHEMIIALTDTSTVKPHKHPDKCESFHILNGSLKISFFDDHGSRLKHLDVVLSSTSGHSSIVLIALCITV